MRRFFQERRKGLEGGEEGYCERKGMEGKKGGTEKEEGEEEEE